MTTFDEKLGTNKRFDFTCTAYDAGKFAVVKMTGSEAISKPFKFMLTLASKDAEIDFELMLKASATFTILAPDGGIPTPYHGVLAEFEQLQQNGEYIFYQAVLVPHIWYLSMYQLSDIYLKSTIPDTLEAILVANKFLKDVNYVCNVIDGGVARDFVCQYKETYLEFVSRWMENEGIYFYFDHSGGIEKLMFGDHKGMHSHDLTQIFHRTIDKLDIGTAANSVQDFVCLQKPLPEKVTLNNFNPGTAGVDLSVSQPIVSGVLGEVNLYGENYIDKVEGGRYATVRAEEIRCWSKVFTGMATAVGLRSGYFMHIDGHYRSTFNCDYLVIEVNHEGSQAAALLAGTTTGYGVGEHETMYRNTFRAIPRDVQFRPERTTAKPRVTSTMNAFIDSSGTGNYADLDEAGCYKVRLPFVLKEKKPGEGSARIRMASPYAGSNHHGMHFPLLKDTEVLLTFIDGDPDQPVILGAVPNSEHPNVVNNVNPYENNITTAGGNLFRMGDKPTKQEIWLHSPTLNTTIGMGNVAARNPEADTGPGEASETSTFKKIISLLLPPVSYRVSTAGSSESLSGGENTSVSRGRSHINLQGDSAVTLLGSKRFTYRSIFDWSSKEESTYRDERVAIDRLDNFALANRVIRHAEDYVLLAAGRVESQKEDVKTYTTWTQRVAKGYLALLAALAIKDVVFVNIAKDGKDPLAVPGFGKIATSASFFVLGQVFGKVMGKLAENIRKKNNFHSRLYVSRSGIQLSAENSNPLQKAVFTVLRENKGFTPPATSSKELWESEPEQLELKRPDTTLGIVSSVLDKDSNSSITHKSDSISLDLDDLIATGKAELVKGAFALDMKSKKGGFQTRCNFTSSALRMFTKYENEQEANGQFRMFVGGIKAQVGITKPSLLELSEKGATLSAGTSGFSKLDLTGSTATLALGESFLAITAAGLDVNGKLIKLG